MTYKATVKIGSKLKGNKIQFHYLLKIKELPFSEFKLENGSYCYDGSFKKGEITFEYIITVPQDQLQNLRKKRKSNFFFSADEKLANVTMTINSAENNNFFHRHNDTKIVRHCYSKEILWSYEMWVRADCSSLVHELSPYIKLNHQPQPASKGNVFPASKDIKSRHLYSKNYYKPYGGGSCAPR